MDRRTEAIEQLYRERYIGFRNALATITGSYDSARDAVQEAFAIALRNRSQLRGEQSLPAWVWRIALRTALHHRAANNRVSPNGALDPGLVEPDRHPALEEALRTLPPRRRLVVFLRYFADCSYSEIAEACGISEGTVAATLARAREQLEAALREEGAPT
jgi:DNA-directed RNA polymerase specialized sigma24 family protein